MSLVAHQYTVAVCPVDPLQREVLIEQVGERLTVVGQHLVAIVHVAQQLCHVFLQVVAATFFELIEKGWCPVGFIHLVGIVEEGVWPCYARLLESLVKAVQVVAHGIAVEMVDDPSLTAWRCALHLLLGTTDLRAIDGFPVYYLFREHRLAGSLLQWYQRTAKRPSRTTVHVDLNAVLGGYLFNILQGLHPTGRQKRTLVLLVALDTIEWRDLHGTDACLGIFRQVPFQIFTVHSRAQPPPTGASLRLLPRQWP